MLVQYKYLLSSELASVSYGLLPPHDLWSSSFVFLLLYFLAFVLFYLIRLEVYSFFSAILAIMYAQNIITLILTASACVWAVPFPSVSVSQTHFEVLALRASTTVDLDAVTGTTCLDTNA